MRDPLRARRVSSHERVILSECRGILKSDSRADTEQQSIPTREMISYAATFKSQLFHPNGMQILFRR